MIISNNQLNTDLEKRSSLCKKTIKLKDQLSFKAGFRVIYEGFDDWNRINVKKK